MTPSLPLYPQILPFSLPLPTSLLQPHSLLTVWQHQSHLTSELLPSTWVFFPREPHDLFPIFWVIAQMLASQWGHLWPCHIKKHLSTPSPRYSKVTSSRKSSLISLFLTYLKVENSFFLPSPFISLSLWSIGSTCITFIGALLFPLYPGLLKGRNCVFFLSVFSKHSWHSKYLRFMVKSVKNL